MKLIIEKSMNQLYAYRENEKMFKINERERSKLMKQIAGKLLDWDCDLKSRLENNEYMVFDIK